MKLDHLEEFIKMGQEPTMTDRALKIALDGVRRAQTSLDSGNVDETKVILARLMKALVRVETQK